MLAIKDNSKNGQCPKIEDVGQYSTLYDTKPNISQHLAIVCTHENNL